ncbi:LOW QUALITY PROTEIN: putative wdr4-prov protein [Schistosoma mansoni]|uniref:putative wdr4-prov protein n=1 Tax=Schistosoma mansoni TaxID=6183 RepID=UPI00022DC15F|nr:LOW QUALITY PROTEIN: putative wdr4-prov protein [Schistosoma mansoni]|eukprot:XP_018649709.1 LOW QUALITY PROTEIN: putative wdr4-prov protein [Schistosoma mansoni]
MLTACREVYLSLKYSFVGWNLRNGIVSETCLPDVVIDPEFGGRVPTISLLTVSSKGSYLSAADNLKRLFLYVNENGHWLLVSQLKLRKQASCLLFSPSEKALLIGDKSGDVFKLPLCLEKPIHDTDLTLLCGHLSLLSHMAISEDEMYLASCDRDEKIRISRFSEPYVIQSFCLGHKSFVSQLGFIPDTRYLISTGGDECMSIWNCESGHCLSSYYVSKSELPSLSVSTDLQFDFKSEAVVSRLYTIKDVVVCCFLSNPVLMAFHIHITEDEVVSWGSKAFTSTEDKMPLTDIALCSNDNRIIGLCSTGTSVRLYSWKLIIQHDACQPSCSVKWDVFQVPERNFLFFKCTDNSSMIKAYESNKQLHQHNVTQRHIRSQKMRKLNKTLQNSVDKELNV